VSRTGLASIVLSIALVACGAGRQPQLTVLSVENSAAAPSDDMVLFVEVMNPAERPLQLHRLQYSFAPSTRIAGVEPVRGEVTLTRIVEAGAAVVVEVPLPYEGALPRGAELMLAGRLYATQDQLERSFAVHARVAALQ
jgi:hypothetical protein